MTSDEDEIPERTLNPNSALYWLDATRATAELYPVGVPKTEVVEFDFMSLLTSIRQGGHKPAIWGDFNAAACKVGWPAFIRTDLSSAKHAGIGGVRANSVDDMSTVVSHLVHDAAAKMMQPAAFVVREWIDIDSEFTAFGGLPIGREFRMFVTPDEHLCTHYYWPEDSIKDPSEGSPVWLGLRRRMAETKRPDWLSHAAKTAATEANAGNAIDDSERAWSVDFARDENGDWWIIDMALADRSWHPECDSAPVEK